MSDLHLRKAVIRLAHQKPEFRAALLPLLKEAAMSFEEFEKGLLKYFKTHPRPLTVSQLTYPMGMDANTLTSWLGRMIKDGTLKKERRGRAFEYSPA